MEQSLAMRLETYVRENKWKELEEAQINFNESCLSFEVKEYHLLLLREMTPRYKISRGDYYAVITTDSKRPYGNSNMEADILRCLTIKDLDSFYDEDGCVLPEFKVLLEEKQVLLHTLHAQMSIVLQIVCATLSVELGVYKRRAAWTSDWTKVQKI